MPIEIDRTRLSPVAEAPPRKPNLDRSAPRVRTVRVKVKELLERRAPAMLRQVRRLRNHVRQRTKVDIVARLAAVHGYRNYLEVCTSGTGLHFEEVKAAQFSRCHRLLYRCPEDYDDGLELTYRSPTNDIAQCLGEIRAKDYRYDVMLVDSWHAYATSFRDLKEMYALLKDGGAIVFHDCLPFNANTATETVTPGNWSGVSYHAFIDFVIRHRDLSYYTVRTDFGCGVIFKPAAGSAAVRKAWAAPGAASGRSEAILAEWREIGHNYAESYRFLTKHSDELLHAISVAKFYRLERLKTS